MESGFWLFKQSLRKLFGHWVVAADAGEDGGDQGVHFDFQDNAQEPGIAEDLEFEFDDDADHGAFDGQFDFDEGDVDGGVPAGFDADQAEGDRLCPDPYMVDLTNSVFIAGLLHVLHNTTSDLAAPLHHWATFMGQLRQVCRLLSRRWSRTRLLETCFGAYPQSLRKSEVEGFRAHVYEGRWGTIWKAIGDLLTIMEILRFAWSKDVFLHGHAHVQHRAGGDDAEHSLHIEVVDEAIRSDIFWAYCVMLDTLGESFELMARWGESCPCHSQLPVLRGLTRWKRGSALVQDIGQVVCPMRTLRAPCCAAGEHFHMLRRLTSMADSSLLLHPCVCRLSDDARTVVLGDFARGRQHVLLCLRVRLSFWQQLPWCLFGLGHRDANVAIDCARRSLALFEGSPVDHSHHSLTLTLCAAEGVGGAQLRLFASRQRSLEELPFLQMMAAKLKFASVTERWIESLHSLAKRFIATAPNVSATHIAFHGIQLPLRTKLAEHPEDLKTLAELSSACRNPVNCLKSMGLWQHPAVVALRRRVPFMLLNRKHSPALTEILYHVDAYSLHAPLPSDSSEDEQEHIDGGDHGGHGPGPGPGGGGEGGAILGPHIGPPDGGHAHGGQGGGGDNDDGHNGMGDGHGGGATAGLDKDHHQDASSSGSKGRLGGSSSVSGRGIAPTGGLPTGASSSSCGQSAGGNGGGGDDQGDHSRPLVHAPLTLTCARSSGGELHDALWCRAALEFFGIRAQELKNNSSEPFFSLGPQLLRSPTDYLMTLSSVVNPEPDAFEGAAVFEFEMDAEPGPQGWESR